MITIAATIWVDVILESQTSKMKELVLKNGAQPTRGM